MRTKEQYFEGLKNMRRNMYFNGSKIDRVDVAQENVLNVMGVTFDAVNDSELKDLCTVKSHLTGETINRFCHVHQTPKDLHNKQNMTRALCRKVGLSTVWSIASFRAKTENDPQILQNAAFVKKYVDRNELGYKTGKGFYSYPNPAYSRPKFLH